MQTELDRTIERLVTQEVRRVLGREHQTSSDSAEVMNANDVAAFLGVDRKTVYDYANRGAIPHRRLGKRMLFSRSALIQWLGSNRERTR